MTSTDESLRLAEEALETAVNSGAWPMKYGKALAAIRAARAQKQESVHPDDEAVNRFSAAMKAKLEQKRYEGRSGWEDKNDCSEKYLNRLLNEHLTKGDPVDVGNFAMMLWNRGERTTAAPVRTKDLTDDEIEDAVVYKTSAWLTNARAVIAAYREKNK